MQLLTREELYTREVVALALVGSGAHLGPGESCPEPRGEPAHSQQVKTRAFFHGPS